MKRKFIIFWTMIMALFLMLTACSGSVPKDSDVEEDIRTFGKGKILEENETITKIEIKNRDTDKKQKTDKVLTNITTEKDDVSYEKKVTLTYHKYNNGWEVQDIYANPPGDWVVKPLKEVSEEQINSTLANESVVVDGETCSMDEWTEYSFTVKKHKADLDKGTDAVTVEVTLDGDVEKASGTMTANYEFQVDQWELVAVTDQEEMTVEIKPDKALNVTADELLDKLDGGVIVPGGDDMGYVDQEADMDDWRSQNLQIRKAEVKGFELKSQETTDQGRDQIYMCSGTIERENVQFDLEAQFEYTYEGGWNDPMVSAKADLTSIDISGKWTGTYVGAGDNGKVELDVTKEGENEWSVIYSYYPDEILEGIIENGSYTARGTFDRESMHFNLTAGDWILKPTDPMSFEKSDVLIYYYVGSDMMEGLGQSENVFKITRAE